MAISYTNRQYESGEPRTCACCRSAVPLAEFSSGFGEVDRRLLCELCASTFIGNSGQQMTPALLGQALNHVMKKMGCFQAQPPLERLARFDAPSDEPHRDARLHPNSDALDDADC